MERWKMCLARGELEMGKKDKDFKLVVGRAERFFSKVWAVKIRKDDIYIMDRNGKDHKVSLHASGICHSAITKEANEKYFHMSPKQRCATKWIIDINQMMVGDAYNIVVPYNQLREQPPIPDSVLRIPGPLQPFSVVIKFIKTRADVAQIDFLSPPTIYPLHTVKLASGEKLWVVYYYTVDLNTVIESAYQMLTRVALSAKPKEPLKLTSGFVSVEDSKKRQYHIDFWLDSLEQ